LGFELRLLEAGFYGLDMESSTTLPLVIAGCAVLVAVMVTVRLAHRCPALGALEAGEDLLTPVPPRQGEG